MQNRQQIKQLVKNYLSSNDIDNEVFNRFLDFYYEGRINDREKNIHNESLEAASYIYKHFLTNKENKQYMLFSATQAGKTNVMTTFSHIWRDHVKNSPDFAGNGLIKIWVFGPSNNALKEQTEERFEKNGFSISYITPAMLGKKSKKNIKKLNKEIEKERENNTSIIFLFDEAHENSGLKDSDESGNEYQNLQTFFQNNRIPLMGTQSNRPSMEIGIHITATPAHLAEGFKLHPDIYEIVMLKPGIGYTGIFNYYEKDLIKNADYRLDDLVKKSKDSKKARNFFDDVFISNYVLNNLKNRKSGYIVVRSAGKNTKKGLENLLEGRESYTEIVEYDCFNENLKSLSTDLSHIEHTGKTIFVLIKQGLGRGITIENKKHIQLCYEFRGNAATSIQSLPGRLSGYGIESNENLMIYTNLEEMKDNLEWLKLFQYENTCNLTQEKANEKLINLIKSGNVEMSGTHFKPASKTIKHNMILKDQKKFDSYEEASNYCLKHFPNYLKIGANHVKSSCSKNFDENIAEGILNDRVMSIGGGTTPLRNINSNIRLSIIHLDGPSENYLEDWINLINSRKFKVGDFVLNIYERIQKAPTGAKMNADLSSK